MKAHRNIRTAKATSHKFTGKCGKCGRSVCEEHSYIYVDESNAAISNSGQYLCKRCYEERYGIHIKGDVEAFRERLQLKLLELAYKAKSDICITTALLKVAEFVKEFEQ